MMTRRGKGATTMFCDEWKFFPPAMNTILTLPLLRVKETSLIAVSTPNSRNEDSLRMERVRYEDGTPLFITETLGLVCPRCVTRGIAQVPCVHREGFEPPWIDSVMDRMISQMMATKEDAIRELGGVLPGDMNTFLGDKFSKQIERSERVGGYEMSDKFIWTMVDPAKQSSEFAIVSVVRLGGLIKVRRRCWRGRRCCSNRWRCVGKRSGRWDSFL